MSLPSVPKVGDKLEDTQSSTCLHVHAAPAGVTADDLTFQVQGRDMMICPCPCKPLSASHKSAFASSGATTAQVAEIDAIIANPKGFHPELLVQLAIDLLATPRDWTKIIADFRAVFAA